MRDAHVLMTPKLRDIVIPCQRHPVTESRFNPSMETIGDRIQKRRKGLGMTQGELGKRAGLGTATISGMELGTQKTTTKLYQIAVALRCRIEWLESGELPIEATVPSGPYRGVREEAPPYVVTRSVHQTLVSAAGAELGAEWDKIQGDEYKQLARDFIYGLVAAQKRAARLPSVRLTTGENAAKNKPRHARQE
jgi:transcriptional regulator with XRE-family HTH domain